MSEFRRFISYIYSYKGSAKLHNTGFAKVEARGEVLRVQVHIKGAQNANNQVCKVYGFFREEGFIKGVLLGQFVVKNGMGDMASVTDRNRIGNANKCLEDLGGIYICIGQEKDIAMATEWDNIAVDTALFKAYEGRNISSQEMNKSKYVDGEIDRISEVRDISSKEHNERQFRNSQHESTRQKEDDRISEQRESPKVTRISENREPRCGEVFATEKITTTVEETIIKETDVLRVEEATKETEIDIKEAKQEKVETSETKDDPVLKEQAVLCGEINLNVENFQKNQPQCEQKHNWEELMKEYTTVHPFEKCENIEVIRIEPKDLNKLSKEYWQLASNSFLLHGYCSYRYLILCKDKQEEKYFLGVPGVFHPREKVIAGMFGFSEFYMSRKGKLRHGEFGYYMRPVQL